MTSRLILDAYHLILLLSLLTSSATYHYLKLLYQPYISLLPLFKTDLYQPCISLTRLHVHFKREVAGLDHDEKYGFLIIFKKFETQLRMSRLQKEHMQAGEALITYLIPIQLTWGKK